MSGACRLVRTSHLARIRETCLFTHERVTSKTCKMRLNIITTSVVLFAFHKFLCGTTYSLYDMTWI